MNAMLLASASVDAVPPIWRILTKFGYFFGLAAVIGAVWTHWYVVRPALRQTTPADGSTVDADRLRARSSKLAGLGALVMLLVAYPQLAARVARAGDGMPYGQAAQPSSVWAYLTQPVKDGAWLPVGVPPIGQNLLIVTVAVMLIPLLFGRWSARADRLIALAAPLSLAISLASLIPTKELTAQEWLGRVLMQGHIIGGSLWVGGLMALALLARERRSLSADAGDVWARMWERFGVLALVSVGMVLISGIWLTWQEVGALEQFVTTVFGRFLALKIVLVIALMAAGAYNQLVLMPKIRRAQTARRVSDVFRYTLTTFPKIVVTEVVLGVAVLGIVPFLSGGARSQAAGHEVDPPVLDGGLLLLGLLMLATMAAAFYGTAKASVALGRREVSGDMSASEA